MYHDTERDCHKPGLCAKCQAGQDVEADKLKRQAETLKKANKARKIEEKKMSKTHVEQARGGSAVSSGGKVSTGAKLRAAGKVVRRVVR